MVERCEAEKKEHQRVVKEMEVKMDAIQKELDDKKAAVEEAKPRQNEGSQVGNDFYFKYRCFKPPAPFPVVNIKCFILLGIFLQNQTDHASDYYLIFSICFSPLLLDKNSKSCL